MISRRELKALINADRWAEIGKLFNFTPRKMLAGRRWVIDWCCVPPAMADVLRKKDESDAVVRRNFFSPARHATNRRRADVLFIEQGGICHYCHRQIERKAWSIDHKIPLGRGGSNRLENIVGACKECNGKKGCLTDEEYKLKITATL